MCVVSGLPLPVGASFIFLGDLLFSGCGVLVLVTVFEPGFLSPPHFQRTRLSFDSSLTLPSFFAFGGVWGGWVGWLVFLFFGCLGGFFWERRRSDP